jgi:hypothetical protein
VHFFVIRNGCIIMNREPDGISHVEDTSAKGSVRVFKKNSVGIPGLDHREF